MNFNVQKKSNFNLQMSCNSNGRRENCMFFKYVVPSLKQFKYNEALVIKNKMKVPKVPSVKIDNHTKVPVSKYKKVPPTGHGDTNQNVKSMSFMILLKSAFKHVLSGYNHKTDYVTIKCNGGGFMKHYKILFVIFALILSVGCGSNKGATETGSTTSDFYTGVQEVAPVFTPTDASAMMSKGIIKAVGDWEAGTGLYEAFYILREFDPVTDSGIIDTSNLYKTMWEARNFVDSTEGRCSEITEQIIPSPFDFGNDPQTYNCALNEEPDSGYDFGGAIKQLDEGGNILPVGTGVPVSTYGLFGFVWVDSSEDNPHNEYGVLQENLSIETSDLSVDIAVWVDYEGDMDYCYRNDIQGNMETHLFTIRSVKGSLAEGTTMTTIVGKGISQGEGNYFLLRITADNVDDKYFCIPATATEATLEAMDQAGSDTVDENCAAYADDVAAMTPFGVADLLCESSDLNVGNAQAGTIFLDFE